MNNFTCFNGTKVDLDDKDIYAPRLLSMDVHTLFLKCQQKAGESLFYMDYLHPQINWDSQRKRVIVLCRELSDIWNFKRKFKPNVAKCTLLNEGEYRMLLLSWLWRFEDETENQC